MHVIPKPKPTRKQRIKSLAFSLALAFCLVSSLALLLTQHWIAALNALFSLALIYYVSWKITRS